LIAVLVGTIGSSLNSLSTVYTMDIYARKINPNATNQEIIKTGRLTVIAGCLFAVLMALAIDSIKGLNLFDVFQSVLGFIAPPLSVVFLLSVFWKRTTRKAVNATLSFGSAISLGVGVVYLWILPPDQNAFWPHYLILSFSIFVFLLVVAMIISLLDRSPEVYVHEAAEDEAEFESSTKVKIAWVILTVVMVGLYIFFSGH